MAAGNNKFLLRPMSLFRMEIKRGNGGWFDWNRDRLFAVHGNNPQPMYNQMWLKWMLKISMNSFYSSVCGNAWIANGNYQQQGYSFIK